MPTTKGGGKKPEKSSRRPLAIPQSLERRGVNGTGNGSKLPGQFGDLVRAMPPQAIVDESQYENMVEMIDRLMAIEKLTKGQEIYLETLVQLVQAYEATRHAIETADLDGLDMLKHLMGENGLNASDIGRLLGVHPSMGSKILKGQRSLTVEHLKKLAKRFKVNPVIFID